MGLKAIVAHKSQKVSLTTMEGAGLAWMEYNYKLGGCPPDENQNPKKDGLNVPIIKILLWGGGGSIAKTVHKL